MEKSSAAPLSATQGSKMHPVAGKKRKHSEISKSAESSTKVAEKTLSTSAVTSNWSKLHAKISSRVIAGDKTDKISTKGVTSTKVHTESVKAIAHETRTVSKISAPATQRTSGHFGGHPAAKQTKSIETLVALGASFCEKGTTAGATGAGAMTSVMNGAGPATADRSRDPAYKISILGPFEDRKLSPFEDGFVALDCEMVGVGEDGRRSELAQVVVVDYTGRVLYNKYVRPKEKVTDYRTEVSGIRPHHVRDAPSFEEVQKEVSTLVGDRIIVGHSLKNDLHALLLGHNWKRIRDTALYKPFCYRNKAGKIRPKRLKHLCQEHLGIVIQEGEHEPAEDARAALALYRRYQREWERSLIASHDKTKKKPETKLGVAPPSENQSRKKAYGWKAKKELRGGEE